MSEKSSSKRDGISAVELQNGRLKHTVQLASTTISNAWLTEKMAAV